MCEVREGSGVSGEILTAEQLADRWQVKLQWVYSKTRRATSRRVPLPGRYYRYRLDVIERFEAASWKRPMGGRRVDPTSQWGGTALTARPRSQEIKSMAQQHRISMSQRVRRP